MKKNLFAILIGLASLTSLHAQTYGEKLEMYDSKRYIRQVGDPYNPLVAGIASYFVPGLGQIICDEPTRGLTFLGGSLGCGVLFAVGYSEFVQSIFDQGDSYEMDPTRLRGSGKMLLGLVGGAVVNIWSIVDAVKVAKVNNMHFQDLNRRSSGIDLEINPYAQPLALGNRLEVPIGLSLRLSF